MAAQAIAAYEQSVDEFEVIGKLKQALESGLVEFPRERALLYLGAAYSDVSMPEQAQQAYEQALALNPDNDTVTSNLGLIYMARNEHARAREMFERAIELQPNNGYAYNNLGFHMLQMGECRQARAQFEKSVVLNPRLDIGFANLARSCARLGDFIAARRAYQEALKRNYKLADSLREELECAQRALPVIYFEREAFLEFANLLMPGERRLIETLERAIDDPSALCDELAAQDRVYYVSEYVELRALAWLVLCDELVRHGWAMVWRQVADAEQIAELLEAARRRMLPTPDDAAAEVVAGIAAGNDFEAGELMDRFVREMEIVHGVSFLILSAGDDRDVVCPVASAVWNASSYPYRDGPDGYGLVRVMSDSRKRNSVH